MGCVTYFNAQLQMFTKRYSENTITVHAPNIEQDTKLTIHMIYISAQ